MWTRKKTRISFSNKHALEFIRQTSLKCQVDETEAKAPKEVQTLVNQYLKTLAQMLEPQYYMKRLKLEFPVD